jgi:Mycothiol maleylpyruvate isomerase N-terminal domain
MERSYCAENDEGRARIQALLASLTDEDLSRPVGPDWTVGVGLMHLAFWDRQWLSKFEEWERLGEVIVPAETRSLPLFNIINAAMLPWWRGISPAQVRHEVLAAAEAIDDKVASLSHSMIEAILATRPCTLVRATHRREHLDEIDNALGR